MQHDGFLSPVIVPCTHPTARAGCPARRGAAGEDQPGAGQAGEDRCIRMRGDDLADLPIVLRQDRADGRQLTHHHLHAQGKAMVMIRR